jgi:hypothetical protein
MPGKSQSVISSNIGELYHANANKPKSKKRPRDQIIAIAESEARRTGRK